MPDPTPPQLPGDESKIYGVSIRAWITVMMVTTVCLMSAMKATIVEPLYSGFLMGLGFFLGQKSK